MNVLDDFSDFWFDNFHLGEQVEFSSFISALVLHFNEKYSTPLFVALPIPSHRPTPAFLPLLINSLLFICLPELSSSLPSYDPSSSSSVDNNTNNDDVNVNDDTSASSPFIRRHEVELFLSHFGGQLRTAFHLAHYSLFDSAGGLYPWFHAHDRSIDLLKVSQKYNNSFLIRFSHTQPGSFSVCQCMDGQWTKHYLSCTMEGWKAWRTAQDGNVNMIGCYDSIHSYITSNHCHQSAIPSILSSLYPPILSPFEAGCDVNHINKRPAPPSPTDSVMSDDSPSLPPLDVQAVDVQNQSFPTSPSPSLSSYLPISGYPLIASRGSCAHPDSPSCASTAGSSTATSVCSDPSTSDGEMLDDSSSSLPSVSGAPSFALHEFFYAISVDDVQAVESFIRFRSVPLTAADEFGLTCVHIACAFNRVRCLHLLKAVVPITMLAAVTTKRISQAEDVRLTQFTRANRHMPYFRTQLVLEAGSPCGSVACGYQSGACLTFIQQWLEERGVDFNNLSHSTIHHNNNNKERDEQKKRD